APRRLADAATGGTAVGAVRCGVCPAPPCRARRCYRKLHPWTARLKTRGQAPILHAGSSPRPPLFAALLPTWPLSSAEKRVQLGRGMVPEGLDRRRSLPGGD